MKIEVIVAELKAANILRKDSNGFTKLSGGTTSELYLIDSRYVIKLNKPKVLQAEVFFLEHYREIALFPNIIYYHPNFAYIVYTFVEGNGEVPVWNKSAMLRDLVKKAINNYQPYSNGGWGWHDEPSNSWRDFLKGRSEDARYILRNHLTEHDHELVRALINNENKYQHLQPYILHGDLGVHNFLFKNAKLSGIIDPTPVIGPPVYDLIYAFCSSPDSLVKEIISPAADLLKVTEPSLNEEILIGLYLRMATCIKHHPADLEQYMEAWVYWKNIIGFNKSSEGN